MPTSDPGLPDAFDPYSRLVQLGERAHSVLDLCTGHNPLGPPESVLAAACLALGARFPDPYATEARRSVGERFGVDLDQVLIGEPSEIAMSCVRAWVKPPCVWLVIEPTLSDVSTLARRAGARVTRWRSVERTGYRVDLEQVSQFMQLERPDVVSLSAPGDLTGASVPFAQLRALAEAFPETRFLVDQSWLPLSDDSADAELLPSPNMLCLRGQNVVCALPSAAASYALGDRKLLAAIAAERPARATHPVAAAIVQALLRERALLELERSRIQLAADRARLAALLTARELTYTPSVVPFLLVRLARAQDFARELFEDHAIAVCDATPSGLPDHLRISSVDAAQAPQLSAALTAVSNHRGLVRGREP